MAKNKVVNVFATDVNGLHQNTEAERAVQDWGALAGIGEGLSGQCYAIPVYGVDGKVRPIEQMRGPVRRFLEFVKKNPNYIYKVGRLGCGAFGYDDFDVAPYFTDAPDSVKLPVGWRNYYLDYKNKV